MAKLFIGAIDLVMILTAKACCLVSWGKKMLFTNALEFMLVRQETWTARSNKCNPEEAVNMRSIPVPSRIRFLSRNYSRTLSRLNIPKSEYRGSRIILGRVKFEMEENN